MIGFACLVIAGVVSSLWLAQQNTDTHHQSFCIEWERNGWCPKYATHMKHLCPLSCNIQDSSGYDVVKSKEYCADESEMCFSWTKAGHCESVPEIMHKACRFSCGLCTKPFVRPPKSKVELELDESLEASMSTTGLTRIGRFFTMQVCKELIDAAEAMQWTMDADSIDNNPVMDIRVFNHDVIYAPKIYQILEPYLKQMKDELDRFHPDVPNKLDWVFFRKYVTGSVRSSLQGHKDTNQHTVNLALNTDFDGGRLYFVPPSSQLGKLANEKHGTPVEFQKAMLPENIPDPVNGNTSNYFFPYMEPGVIMVYDNTVWHGVTHVTKGTRFSLSFFYDEPKEIREGTERVTVSFRNKRVTGPVLVLYWLKHGIKVGDTLDIDVAVDISGGSFSGLVTQATFKNHLFAVAEKDSLKVIAEYRVQSMNQNFILD